MKNVTFTTVLLILFLLGNAATDGTNKQAKGKKGKKKEHVCTSSCTQSAHAYAHGEKGHTCTQECHKK